ncbi:MAG: glucose-1-phosphate thymidylyltransferase [Armatimonadetes bacterium]|nr:glucose-1-phosphate thymidylyltransferase [Armatimonadota bacterium]
MLSDYFELGSEPVFRLMERAEFPWDPLKELKPFLQQFLAENGGRVPEALHPSIIIKGDVHIEDGVLLEEGIFIQGPAVLQSGAQVRFGAYIRGNVWIGPDCVVGHDTEVKHSLFLPGAKAAHFAYVGDSILGRDVNLGAGTKLANVKVDMGRETVKVRWNGAVRDSGLRKIGAILGDGVSLGCNTVTSPGTLVGKNSLCYPLSSLSGVYPPNQIIKFRPELQLSERR